MAYIRTVSYVVDSRYRFIELNVSRWVAIAMAQSVVEPVPNLDLGPSAIGCAVLLTILFTCLLAFLKVARDSQASARACVGWPFVAYVLIFLIGNTVTTILAVPLVVKALPPVLSSWFPLFFAFSGVFAFQGVLAKANITFYGNGVLTIEEWIALARDHAVESAAQRQSAREHATTITWAHSLQQLPPEVLNTYLVHYLSQETVLESEERARATGADPHFYKALRLATEKPKEAQAIVASHPSTTPQLPPTA